MFNAVNNPFGKRIESAISTGQEKHQRQQNQQQKPKPIEDKKGTVSYARISLMNARQIYGPKARNHTRLSQPLKSITGKLIKVSEIIRNQAEAEITSLGSNRQIQRSSSTFKSCQ